MSIDRTERMIDQLGLPHLAQHDQLMSQFSFGDFARGRFAWRLSKIRPLKVPVGARGDQQLWEWSGGASLL
ncbi:MAG TPA: hypothetical protein VF614_10235 [Chthoniobacteraceae bacterium]